MGRGVKTEWVTEDFGHAYRGTRVYRKKTRFQTIELWRNPTLGLLLFLDGKLQVAEVDENRYHQHLVAAPLLAHPAPRAVCIVGGGDCLGIEEATKFRSLRRILQIEIDHEVVRVCRSRYPAVRQALRDPRVEIVIADGRAWLETNQEQFNVIVVDLTEPHGPATLLYTREFYQLCRRRLTANGILSIHADDYALYPETFATISRTLAAVFPHILTARVDMPSFGMDWTFRMAAGAKPSLGVLRRRLAALSRARVAFDQLNPSLYLVTPGPDEQRVLTRFGRISTDAAPHDKFAGAGPHVLDVNA